MGYWNVYRFLCVISSFSSFLRHASASSLFLSLFSHVLGGTPDLLWPTHANIAISILATSSAFGRVGAEFRVRAALKLAFTF
jgi:hypothetical protein